MTNGVPGQDGTSCAAACSGKTGPGARAPLLLGWAGLGRASGRSLPSALCFSAVPWRRAGSATVSVKAPEGQEAPESPQPGSFSARGLGCTWLY